MKVLILGSGPSSAYATQALQEYGLRPRVISREASRYSGGAFWLHWLPEAIREQARLEEIAFMSVGTAERYAFKQWGGMIGEDLNAWFPHQSRIEYGYDPYNLTLMHEGHDEPEYMSIRRDSDLEALSQEYGLIIQTFPTAQSVTLFKEFRKPLWITSREEYIHHSPRNMLVFVGNTTPILRISHLFGYHSVEWSERPRFSIDNVVLGWKLHPSTPWEEIPPPLHSNILMTGRFATWNRKEHCHHSYLRVRELLRRWEMSGFPNRINVPFLMPEDIEIERLEARKDT